MLGKWTLQIELYKDHPYGHPDIGTAHGLKSITLEDVKAFHRRHYSRKSLKLGLAGGFDPGIPGKILESFASLAEGSPPLAELPAPRTPQRPARSRSSRSRPKRRRSRSASPSM